MVVWKGKGKGKEFSLPDVNPLVAVNSELPFVVQLILGIHYKRGKPVTL